MINNPITNNHLEEVEYISNLLYESFQLSTFFIDDKKQLLYSLTYNQISNPLYEDRLAHLLNLFNDTKKDKKPMIRSSLYMENYLSIPYFHETCYCGQLIIGPSLFFYPTSIQIDELMIKYKFPLNRKRQLTIYFNTLRVIDYNRLISMGQMVYYILYKKYLDKDSLINKSGPLNDITTQVHNQLELTVSNNHMQTFFHHTLQHEKHLLHCIREGNTTQLRKVINQALDGERGILSRDNPLRSEKNLAICMVTLATRAAIEGGLNTENAFTLSDLYIQKIEALHDTKDLVSLNNQIIYDFTKQVKHLKLANYSKPIVQSLHLISNKLYEPLTLSYLAKSVGLSPHYFASRFKEEVGFPVMTYIQREKINEAKRLLAYSRYSILEISNSLGFYDQSHFTKQFHKWTHMTPRKYKEKQYA